MTESGGSTTQSGIYFQNTIAALYMGRMLDPRISDLTQRVSEVRVEAREYVDDVVVTFTDGHRRFIQAKENIDPKPGNETWRKLWGDFEKQCWDTALRPDDRLVIFLGFLNEDCTRLATLCERARGAVDLAEWQDILKIKAMEKSESEVRQLLSPGHQNSADTLTLLQAVEVEQRPLNILESFVPAWMPPNNKGEQGLFSTLRDLCGGGARFKTVVNEATLKTRLQNSFGIEINPPPMSKENNLITGSILFEDGRPAENAKVRIIGLDLDQIVTGSDGYFKFMVDDQPSWTVQASYKDMSVNISVKKKQVGMPVIIKFPHLACFSIDSPIENEEVPLGEKQERIIEGSFPILTAFPRLAETAKIELNVYKSPEGMAVQQSGTEQISINQGKWYYVTAKFSTEGIYSVIAKAKIGNKEDFRKVQVNCVNKQEYYERSIDEDQKIRGVKGQRLMKSNDINLNALKQDLSQKQVEFFDYFDRQDYQQASQNIASTLEILDLILPIYPEDLWLQNTRAYTFKNYALVMRNQSRDDEFMRGLAEAEKMFRAIRDQDPDDAGAWNGLGSVAGLRGEYKKALEYIDKALEIDPNYPEALLDRETMLRYIKT